MSPLITTEWDLVIVGAALTVVAFGLLFTWSLCRAAALADRAMERTICEDIQRSGS
ncbi:MAG TPA: hypothetical protein PKN47_01785 [Nitrospira sp.]|nr:hypothetical protein [Nitrospira sp.]